jgi:uncharacterized protein (TIGR02246 family)
MAPGSPYDLSADVQTLHEIRQRVEAAENAGDTESFVAIMADDIVLMVPDQPVQQGREACAAFVRNVLAGLLSRYSRHITYASDEVDVIGTVAFDRGTFAFTVTPREGGATTRVTGKYLWLMRRAGEGAWRMSRVMMSVDEGDEEMEA